MAASHARSTRMRSVVIGGLCVCLTRRDSVSHAKTAEPIELTFKMWTRVDPINHVLNGDPIPARVVTHCGGKEVINIRHAQTCL